MFTSQGKNHIFAWNWTEAASIFNDSKLYRDENPTEMDKVLGSYACLASLTPAPVPSFPSLCMFEPCRWRTEP